MSTEYLREYQSPLNASPPVPALLGSRRRNQTARVAVTTGSAESPYRAPADACACMDAAACWLRRRRLMPRRRNGGGV